jgi:hypothetical protein
VAEMGQPKGKSVAEYDRELREGYKVRDTWAVAGMISGLFGSVAGAYLAHKGMVNDETGFWISGISLAASGIMSCFYMAQSRPEELNDKSPDINDSNDALIYWENPETEKLDLQRPEKQRVKIELNNDDIVPG